jgi:hypothetical protein
MRLRKTQMATVVRLKKYIKILCLGAIFLIAGHCLDVYAAVPAAQVYMYA